MKYLLTALLTGITALGFAQSKFFTRNGTVTFFSSAPLEDITAKNYSTIAVLDTETGNIEFSALMKSFEFKKALMQEHFNENYVESDKFPKAVFVGSVRNLSNVDFNKDGEYDTEVSGEMTIHGISQRLTAAGQIIKRGERISLQSKFILKPEDYEIKIPDLVRDKIAQEIEVTVKAELEELKR